jgi:hypothetical protein
MRHRRLVPAPLLFALLAGCRAAAAGPAAAVRVELAGGSNPGVYQATADQPACTRDLVGPGSWGVQLTDWKGPKAGLRSLQLVVPAPAQQDQFYLGLVFGDFFTGIAREIETRPASPRPKGNGRVSIEPYPGGATVRVTGVTQDSVAVTATIACTLTQEEQGGSR